MMCFFFILFSKYIFFKYKFSILIIKKEEGGRNLVKKLRTVSHCFDHLILNYVELRSNFRAFLSEARVGSRWKETMRLYTFAVAARVALRLKNLFKAADSSSRFAWMKSLNGLATRENNHRIFNQLFILWLCHSFVEEEVIHRWDLKRKLCEHFWSSRLIKFKRDRRGDGRRIFLILSIGTNRFEGGSSLINFKYKFFLSK